MPEILHHTVEYKHHKTDYGIIVRDLVSNFGTLHIVHAPALDDLGYSNFMVVIPMQKAKYYHNINGNSKTYEIDLKKAGNEAREASRFIYIESGALKAGRTYQCAGRPKRRDCREEHVRQQQSCEPGRRTTQQSYRRHADQASTVC